MPAPATYSLHDICRRLGARGGEETKKAYIRSLIADYGFPSPYPTPVKGRGATRTIRTTSQWAREPVDAWFHDYHPPKTHAAIERTAADEAAARLDARADNVTLLRSAS